MGNYPIHVSSVGLIKIIGYNRTFNKWQPERAIGVSL